MGNYVGNNPNGVDLFMSDDYTSNSSKLLASTKCVYKAIEGAVGKQAATKMKRTMRSMLAEPEEGTWISQDGRSWSLKTSDGLIINCGYTPDEGEVVFHYPFTTKHWMLIGVGAFSKTAASFVPECVNVQYMAIGV